MDDHLVFVLVSAAIALASGLISAAVNSWLTGRAKVSEELREKRLEVYPALWKRTMTFSLWPWTDATQADLERFHTDLRGWYYSVGGLYLSDNARARYGELQELVAAILEQPSKPDVQLADGVYDALAKTCSGFRTALTEDLESRRQNSLPTAIRRALLHRRQRRAAQARIREASTGEPGHRIRVDADVSEAAPTPAATA
jgi:hypothetical protein